MLPDISNLKKKRLLAGLTQQELAKLSGVSQSLIAKIEAGLLDPTVSKARKIVSALTVTSSQDKLAKDIISKVVSFPPETLLSKAIFCMQKEGFSQFPVIKNKDILGFVTEKTILAHPQAKKVKEVMIPPPPILDISTPVTLIKQLLMSYGSVLIIKNGVVIGIVTPADLIKIM